MASSSSSSLVTMMTTSLSSLDFQHMPLPTTSNISQRNLTRVGFFNVQQNLCLRTLSVSCNFNGRSLRQVVKPISAVSSGMEASILEDNAVTLKDIKIVVESQDGNKMQLRVDVTGAETQKTFEIVLRDLARTAPPVPGFRREKGGKTSKVPRDFLLQILGEERVTKFVIQEIVSSTIADYAKKENLIVKDNKINTTQTVEELKKLFSPGNEFGFNVIMELEEADVVSDSDSDSEPEPEPELEAS